MCLKKSKFILLPTTEKAGPISIGNKSKIAEAHLFRFKKSGIYENHTFQHLYILSDEKIKEGDWVCCLIPAHSGGRVLIEIKNKSLADLFNAKDYYKKIIATTDKSLLVTHKGHEHGTGNYYEALVYLPEPSQSFIEEFVKGLNKGNITSDVMVEYEQLYLYPDGNLSKVARLAPNAIPIERVKVSEDSTITIKEKKDSLDREEIINLLKFFVSDTRGDKPWVDADDEWVSQNL